MPRIDYGPNIEVWLNPDPLGPLRQLGAVEPVDP